MDDYIISIFNLILAIDEVVLFFHPDDLWVLKEIRSYKESYKFHIHMENALIFSNL